MTEYPEIVGLKNFAQQTACGVSIAESPKETLPMRAITLTFVDFQITVLTDNEYQDLAINNPLLHLELALRAIGILKEEPDFLTWCKALGLNGSNSSLLAYYTQLVQHAIPQMEHKLQIGSIGNYINDLDFQLNAGAARALRENKTTMH